MQYPIEEFFKTCLWRNFGAAIDMLREIIRICPDSLWQRQDRFYYMTYHTTIFLDYYLSIPVSDFHARLPYTLADPGNLPAGAIDDVIPDRLYSREDMLDWLASIRSAGKTLVTGSSGERLMKQWIRADEVTLHVGCPSGVTTYSILEIIFYNFRHVQHHVAQLNQMLRTEAGIAADWITQSD
jgi:hypothetical protein